MTDEERERRNENFLPVSIWNHNSLMNYKFIERARKEASLCNFWEINHLEKLKICSGKFDDVCLSRLGVVQICRHRSLGDLPAQRHDAMAKPDQCATHFMTQLSHMTSISFSVLLRLSISYECLLVDSEWLIARTFNFFFVYSKLFLLHFVRFSTNPDTYKAKFHLMRKLNF